MTKPSTACPAESGTAVAFRNVDVLFGNHPAEALRLLDQGLDRAAIQERTGQVVGVAGATLDIREGEICVLMGLSGSGKSTLLRCVNGLNRPSRGQVLVTANGRTTDVSSCRPAELKQLRSHGIAMVFQQFALLPWRTVAENVGFGLELQGMPKHKRDIIVAERLAMVGLEAWKDAYAHELSGGMQQRVGLARAFAMDAPILLMDEPFSALDPLIRSKLQDELLDLQKQLKKTIIFVSHDLDEAMKIGSRIAIMESGRIVQTGTPEEIALNPVNAYVQEFVAHMNPVNVLRGASIMTPLDALKQLKNGTLVAETETRTTVQLDPDGAPHIASMEGRAPVPIVEYAGPEQLEDLPERAVVAAPVDITMREAIQIRNQTGAPIVMQEDGKAVGVIGNKELYGTLLGSAPGEK
ncbi:choline ABC transporter ATP-binding protein [Indioceanicola profundi]|uniref:choline ABC transporter ATP-binding protein n=1 Tax=Indioceanicola profundi TaxID=2220096 RepID=UPI000E6A9ABE|nr:choline ABC transporter ATP-binding protein [Indioceanicola profundi]